MKRPSWLLLFVLLKSLEAQDNQFKSCAEVDFCQRLRHVSLDDASKFSARFDDLVIDSQVVSIPLHNENGDDLILQISLLADGKARIKINEPDSQRFELRPDWALTGEPTALGFEIQNEDGNLILSNGNNKVIVARGPPFGVEFYYNDQLEIALSGDRLIMENTETSQAYAFEVQFEGSEKLYGLFDHSYRLALGETADDSVDPFRMKNVDASMFDYYPADSTKSLYGSVSAIYGHSQDHTAGVFLHNGAEQWIDISYNGERPTGYFMVESAALDLFVLLGPSPKEVVRQFTSLTGTAHLPQLWVLGYHQCRMSYHSQDDVKTVVALMQENEFPMDAIWIARDYSDDNRWFKWNATAFSDPIEMQQNISSLNKKCVTISDPHFKIDENYDVYVGGETQGYYVRNQNGTNYEGVSWPGPSTWIDYFLPAAADYYASWYSYDKWNETTPVLAGIWNDMNEPSVFNGIEGSFSSDLIHRIDDEETEVLHRDVHNLYGLMHVKATHRGLLERDNYEVRPFILTRSHFAGSQRYSAMWTGDNNSTWEHFANSFSQCLTGNLLGMVLCGPDVGGFFGDPTEELIQRWYQGGAWLPFYRGHSHLLSKRREPYLYPEDVRNVIRRAIELRYMHIPYLYTLFFEHTLTGDPIISPLFYNYPGVQEYDTQMLVGGNIMPVAIVNESVNAVSVYFPGNATDIWYRIDRGYDVNEIVSYAGGRTENIDVDINSSPVFYRGGSIIPTREDVKLSTSDTISDPFLLVVNVGWDNTSTGNFYLDDYTSFNYYVNNSYYYFNIQYSSVDNSFTFSTISGNPSGFGATFGFIFLNRADEVEEGILKVEQTKYSTTRDGRLLTDINIIEEMSKLQDEAFVLYV